MWPVRVTIAAVEIRQCVVLVVVTASNIKLLSVA